MTDWEPLILSLKLASVTTMLLMVLAVPLAYWLAFSRSKVKPVIESLITMPLVLPPTVIGFYILIAFGPSQGIGLWLREWLGISLIFSFEGLVLASVIYSLPFMIHPVQAGLAGLPESFREAASVMGKSKPETLLRVLLPNIKPSLLTGIVLTFAHTVGEFGVVLMIGGNIPGRTKVASIAIYNEVEAMNYGQANRYSLVLFLVTFLVLLFVYLINGNYLKLLRK